MLKTIAVFLLSIYSVSSLAETISTAAGNPLEGSWEWTNIKNSCVETYIFAADGSAHITSGTELSNAHYEIAKSPDANGFYKVSLTITEDKGGKDCSEDESNNTGETYIKYLMFHPAGSQYVSCDKPSTDSCVGPLQKVR